MVMLILYRKYTLAYLIPYKWKLDEITFELIDLPFDDNELLLEE
jgi:hypothetical protein